MGHSEELSKYDHLYLHHQNYGQISEDEPRFVVALNYLKSIPGIIKVLDAGVGKGGFYRLLKKRYDAWGIEPSRVAIEKFHRNDSRVLPILLHDLPSHFQENEFDAIACLDVLEHIPPEDLDLAFRSLVYAGNKYFVFSIANHEDFCDGMNLHVSLFTFEEWEKKLQEYFRIVSKEQIHGGRACVFCLEKINAYISRDCERDNSEDNYAVYRRMTLHDPAQSPLVSILVPTYNHADYLPDTLNSLLSQTYENWESIIVNDGSTDNTRSVLDEYASRDRRFRVFHKENGGTASALNKALTHVRGEWVCWLSSDDLLEPDALDIFLTAIRDEPEYKFFHSHFYLLEEETGKKIADGEDRHLYLPQDEDQVISFFIGNYVHGISIAVHKSVFDRVGGFNKDLRFAQDVDMWLRISALFPSKYIHKRTCVTRVSNVSGTLSFPEAGPIDVARLCMNFLNRNRFAALFPLLDLQNEAHVLHAVQMTVRVASNPHAHMYKGVGYVSTLMDRFCEWLSCDCPEKLKDRVLQKLESVLNDVRQAELPLEIKYAFENLRMLHGSQVSYTPDEPLSMMLHNMRKLEAENNHAEEELIRRYLSKQKHLPFSSDLLTINSYRQEDTGWKATVFPESMLAHKWLDSLRGIEVGPSSHNPFGLHTRNVGIKDDIYEKEQMELAGCITPLDIIARADDIPVEDESEDFILSSHVMEHCPDLIKTLLESYRIVRKGGYIFMVVPLRNASPADRGRPLTDWLHILDDYINNTTEISEPDAGQFGHCHYHVFDIDHMKAFIHRIFQGRLQLVDSQGKDDKIGNGFTLVYKKTVSNDKSFPWYIGDKHINAEFKQSVKPDVENDRHTPVRGNSFVNICMVTYNRLEFTRQSIDSIVKYNDYPYVLTVVDNNSQDGTKEYLKELKNKGIIKNLVLLDANIGIAKASNLAWIQEQQAAYYMKLDNDIVFQKSNWLSRIVYIADNIPETGAVAYNFEPVSYPLTDLHGYHVRVKHGNLGGACILIPERTHKILGYWCEDYGLYGEEDGDYGIRIILAGLLNVYMEDEDIGLHLPAGKAARIDTDFNATDGVEEQIDPEYRQWKDVQRRNNIELFERYKMEYQRETRPLYVASEFARKEHDRNMTNNMKGAAGEKEASLPLNIIVFTNDPVHSACPVIRINSPFHYLQESRLIRDYKMYDGEGEVTVDPELLRDLDLVVMQRIGSSDNAEQVFEFAAKRGVPVIYDLDDLFTEMPSYNNNGKPSGIQRDDVIQIIKKADAVTVSTECLRERVAGFNPNTCILPNFIDPAIWNVTEKNVRNNRITTFGIFGTPTHSEDIRMVYPAIKRILAEFAGEVRFRVLGCSIPEFQDVKGIEVIDGFYLGYADYAKYLQKAEIDAVLVPLIQNKFNICKSNIKYLEYSVCGIPGIYSRIEPYMKDVRHGHNGLIADAGADSWYECMKMLIKDTSLRNSIASRAHDDVCSKYNINTKYKMWHETYTEICRIKRKKASIIIPVCNNLEYNVQCLEHVSRNTEYEPYEVIIVDNGSTDGTGAFLDSLEGDVKIITNKENFGFAKACNQGASVAEGDYLIFLNNDTKPLQGWLSHLIKTVEDIPDAAIVGSKLLYPDDTVQHAGVVFKTTDTGCFIHHLYRGIDSHHPAVNYMREFNAVTAACMLVRKEVFYDAGMFDEGFINGYEDVDLCLKVREKGYKIMYTPDSMVYHYEEKTEGRCSHGEHNTNHFLRRWMGRLRTDDIFRALDDGILIQNLPGDRIRYQEIEGSEKTRKTVSEAIRYSEQGDYSRAILLCEEILKDDVSNKYALKLMGNACNQTGDPARAVKYYAELVSVENSYENLCSLAAVQKKLNTFWDAAETYNKALIMSPDIQDQEIYINIGECCIKSGDIEKAREYYVKALEINGSDDRPYSGLGVIETQTGNNQQALEYFRKSIEINPGSSKAVAGTGLIHLQEGDKEKAFYRFTEALNLCEDDVSALVLLIQAAYELDRLPETEPFIESYLSLHPADLNILYKYAEICITMNRHDTALENLRKILIFDPARKDALNLLNQIESNGNGTSVCGAEVSTSTGSQKNIKKIAVVRGANLNKWEMQNYEPIQEHFELTAYTTNQTNFDISNINLPVVQLPFKHQGLLMEMEGLEDGIADKDLVFSADITYKFSAQAIHARQRYGCRVVCLEWENIPYNYEEYEEVHHIKETVRNGADHFIAVTERAKEALVIEGVPEEKIDVIPMGVDLKVFRPVQDDLEEERRKFGIDREDIVVLFIGRMVWEKGVYDLLHAASSICRDSMLREKQVRFLMVGKGPELKGARERAGALGISSSFTFIEEYPYKDMYKLHNIADMFVLPSIPTRTWQEQFGMVLIESMACGTPVISTYSGSIPEVVGDGGMLVQPNDHLSLYTSMKEMITNKEHRTDLGKMALKRAKTMFDSKKISDKVKAVFNNVLSQKTEADLIQENHVKSITYWEQGEKENAFSMVCETYEKDQDNKSVLDSVIRMGMELEQYESVEKSIKDYLQCHPANLDALVCLAEVLMLTGMTDQAKKELKKVLIFDPMNGKANLLLDQIEDKNNSIKQLS